MHVWWRANQSALCSPPHSVGLSAIIYCGRPYEQNTSNVFAVPLCAVREMEGLKLSCAEMERSQMRLERQAQAYATGYDTLMILLIKLNSHFDRKRIRKKVSSQVDRISILCIVDRTAYSACLWRVIRQWRLLMLNCIASIVLASYDTFPRIENKIVNYGRFDPGRVSATSIDRRKCLIICRS